MTALADFATALAAARAAPDALASTARAAVAAIGPSGGPFKSFIAVAAAPAPDPARTGDALLGCLFSVKDNIDAVGYRTTCGSRIFAEAPAAQADSWIVAALKATGATLIGKNNMHEFALGATGVNPVFGDTLNPRDPTRNVGGSSGGSANAVAMREVHLAIGTDSGGSVRMPAAFTGITGYKPSSGLLPMTGVAGESWTMDALGLFTQDAADARTVMQAIVAMPEPAPATRMRIGYLADDSMGRVEPVVWDAYMGAIERLRRQEDVALTPISLRGFDVCPEVCISIVYPEVASAHYELMRQRPAEYDQHIRALIALGELWSSRNYLDAQRLRTVIRRRMAAAMAPFDAVITPTVPIQPPMAGVPAHVTGDDPDQSLYTLIRFTVVFNVTGHPAISIPAGDDRDGLPFGLQIAGHPQGDAALLDIATRLQAAAAA